ncbi:hypothetical protein EPR50_G00058470 [Perca flavescens]|uniref:Uncharacterized protein n=1 Tax=Perca flavescens TaxID=8167 RepID=A0A484D728_PERFV|nr:hypothetical protein EPR50_G00058470 [Perca flavescens]
MIFGPTVLTKSSDPLLAVRLLLFTLHTVLIVIVTSIIIKRTCVRKKADVTVQPPDAVEEPRRPEERGRAV